MSLTVTEVDPRLIRNGCPFREAVRTPLERSEITEKVRKNVGALLNSPTDFPETDLLSAHGLDSLTSVQLTLYLEDEFGVLFEDDELSIENFATLESIVGLLDKKVQE
jgi:acyl carrier protein